MFTTAAASSTWLTGFTVCLSLIASIGAQNLYVLRQAVQGEHVRACVAWCVVSDALLVALGVAGMAQLLGSSPLLAQWLQWGGALFLLAYGLFAWHRAFLATGGGLDAGGDRVARGLLGVVSGLAVITLLNPHVYLDTVLLIGSIGARQDGWLKAVFVLGAASASLTWFAVLAFAGRRLQRVFANPLAWRVLDALTGAMMFVLAWWVWRGV
ncbi:lysine transporter LysE [Melaminivora suipulveris]|uniref:Lysine transporter LysE n=1 Tax=Melaminivora suipulveris TaxID=2109913 RepID=A0A2R3Q816_9BURK|nr:LysE family transporter [Melaminivora suipulveris]AVO47923.1 lysine transporter LysE [Melaminivora suipulveris]